MAEYLDGYGIEFDWWWVLLSVSEELQPQFGVQLSLAGEARVIVPQRDKHLIN